MALKRLWRRSTRSARLTSSSPITTSTSGNGVAAIRALRERFGRSTPAILATADRSPEVRDEAARADVIVMTKPLKPAPLRAQLTRYTALREAAE